MYGVMISYRTMLWCLIEFNKTRVVQTYRTCIDTYIETCILYYSYINRDIRGLQRCDGSFKLPWRKEGHYGL